MWHRFGESLRPLSSAVTDEWSENLRASATSLGYVKVDHVEINLPRV